MRLSQFIEREPVERRKKKGAKPSIAAHGAFVPLVTVWGAALLGLSLLVMPLYLPTMVLGARAIERASIDLDYLSPLALQGAVTLAALAITPFAAAAALRVNMR